MSDAKSPFGKFRREVVALYGATSTTEKSYYPAIKELWARLLESRSLPFDVRVETSEGSTPTGTKLPDLALYDRGGFASVLAEVKTPDVEIAEMAVSVEDKNQVGRYLCRTGVMLLCNVRAVGLLACNPGYVRQPDIAVPPDKRNLLVTVQLWGAEDALGKGGAIGKEAETALADLLERAVTEFAPIATPHPSRAFWPARRAMPKPTFPSGLTRLPDSSTITTWRSVSLSIWRRRRAPTSFARR